MLLLLAVTVVCVLIVCYHVVELLFDDTAMPRGMEDPLLGAASFSMFGSLGAAVQVILILYLMISSVVGFYSSPLFTGLRPRAQDTTLTQIIGNCVSLLVLSSALPVFSRTLGITRFDLLGDFGRFNWLGNFHIVFLYNILFAGLTSACLINTLTWTVQRELIRAFGLHKLPSTVSRSTIPLRLLLANGLSKIQWHLNKPMTLANQSEFTKNQCPQILSWCKLSLKERDWPVCWWTTGDPVTTDMRGGGNLVRWNISSDQEWTWTSDMIIHTENRYRYCAKGDQCNLSPFLSGL